MLKYLRPVSYLLTYPVSISYSNIPKRRDMVFANIFNPGLQDSNLARVKATQDYLMRCSNIFIVAKISRAITDQSLKSSLFSVLSRHVPLEWEESGAKSLNVAVVCTRSEVRRAWFIG